jgi:transcriptional regulator GlxA family with amidase domain
VSYLVKRIGLLSFPGMTALDLVAVYDALRRVAPMQIDREVACRVIGTKQSIVDETGLTIIPDGVFEELKQFDLLYVPGGLGTRALMHDGRFVDYLKSWPSSKPLASACTGSLLLGAAGHLKGKRATTHHLAHELLAPWCKEVVTDQRIVAEGNVVTAAGVTAALDLGLYLVDWLWGEEARDRIAAVMEYPAPQPA